eukprot:403342431
MAISKQKLASEDTASLSGYSTPTQDDSTTITPIVEESYYWEILNIAIPANFAIFQWVLFDITSLYFIGSIGEPILLAAFGVANVLLTVLVVILLGLNSTLNTLVSQSYGQHDMEMCRTYIGRGRVVVTLAYLPIAVILMFSNKFFELVNIDEITNHEATLYVRYSLISIFFHIHFDISRQACNSFGQAKQIMITFLFTIVFHPVWNYIFIKVLDQRMAGAAMANICSFLLNLIVIHILISCQKSMKEAFRWPNGASFKGILDYVQIGIPSMLMWCLKSWCFQIQILISSFVGPDIAAAQIIIHSVLRSYYTSTLALQQTSACLIGQSLGAQNLPKVKVIKSNLMRIGFLLGFCQMISIYFFGEHIFKFFSNADSVLQTIESVKLLVSLNIFFDCCQGWIQGIIRGFGAQDQTLKLLILVFYGFCLPSQIFMIIQFQMGLTSIWIALLSSMIILSSYYFYMVNWGLDEDLYAKNISERHLHEKIQLQVRQQRNINNCCLSLNMPLVEGNEKQV